MTTAQLQSRTMGAWVVALALAVLFLSQWVRGQSNEGLAASQAPPAITTVSAAKPAVEATAIEPRTAGERFQDYRNATFSPWALFTPAIGAGLGQATNYPSEWKQGAEGFGKRLASAYGGVVVENTISLGVSYIDHEDLRYPLSTYPKNAIFKRVGHAFAYTFVPRKEGGGRRFGWAQLAGAYGAGFAANTWYPSRRSSVGNAFLLGSMNLAGDLGVNLLKEFIRPHLVFENTHKADANKNYKNTSSD